MIGSTSTNLPGYTLVQFTTKLYSTYMSFFQVCTPLMGSSGSLNPALFLWRYNSAAKHANLVGQKTALLLQFLVDKLGDENSHNTECQYLVFNREEKG